MLWLILISLLPYLFLIFRVFKGLRKTEPFIPDSPATSFLSVIVACRNEEENLSSLLRSLQKQDYDNSFFEVIIVDDNSSDQTFDKANEFSSLPSYKVIRNPGTGKKEALAAGILQASGKVIVTTDADCRHGKRWLSTIASFFEANEPDLVICPVMTEGRDGIFGKLQEIEFLSLQGVTAGTAGINDPVMCNGANLAFTREAYIKSRKDLHPELVSGDDVFLLHSLKQNQSSRILWLESPDSLVFTNSQNTLGSFIRQRVRWISKAGAYSDRHTIILGIVTFVTILIQGVLTTVSCFNLEVLPVFLGFVVLKSVPDLLIIADRAVAYSKKHLLWWLVPSQLLYPFYVLAVSSTAVFSFRKFHIR